MSAREKILARLAGTKNPPSRKPEYDLTPTSFNDKAAAFKSALEAAGGEWVEVREGLDRAIEEVFGAPEKVVDTRNLPKEGALPKECDLLILEAAFGVAENGALWIDPQDRFPRSLLTLSENIAVILKSDAIVDTMHGAYGRIDLKTTPYALFLCGPSKTADIEQSLVIGAHGAMRLVVFLD